MTALQHLSPTIPPAPPLLPDRVVGTYGRIGTGPTLVILASLHGNEPAGVKAGIRVLDRLNAVGTPMRGHLVVLRGNLPAIAAGRRYLDRDLNRLFSPARVGLMARGRLPEGEVASREHAELRRLLRAIARAFQGSRGPRYLLDVHTSSADGPPFGLYTDAVRNRAFALALGVPMLVGLEEHLLGIATDYMTSRGVIAAGIEAGQHDAASAVDNAEGALWAALFAAGLLSESDCRYGVRARAHLRERSARLPRLVEIFHRQSITPSDAYRTRPGFTNFDRIAKGDVIGHDRRGAVRAAADGCIIMPLYQPQGEDAFFLGRSVSDSHLRRSALLRRLRPERLLALLPGFRRDGSAYLIPRGLAAGRLGRAMRLLGYRRTADRGARARFARVLD